MNGTALPIPVLGNGTWDGVFNDPLGNDTGGVRGLAVSGAFSRDTPTIMLPAWSGANPNTRGSLAAFVITAVPEPGSAVLAIFGSGLVFLRKRR